MSTCTEYKHLLLHRSVLQHRVGSLYEENSGPECDVLIQSITRELQRVLAACRASPFDKTVPEPIFGPPALFHFPSVSPLPPPSPPVLVLVSPMVFPPDAAEPLFLPDDNLLVGSPFIFSPSLFCTDLSEFIFLLFLHSFTNSGFFLFQPFGWTTSPCHHLHCPIFW